MSTLQNIDPECIDGLDSDPVETIIIPRALDTGRFEVRRALPSKERQMVGPFMFWAQMGTEDFLVGLALPKNHEENAPAFHHTDGAEFPELEYEGMKARVIMGDLWGQTSSVNVFSDTLYLDVQLDAGATFELPVETEERAIYALEGKIEIGGVSYDPMQLLALRPGDQIVVKALVPTRMMVLGGEAMDGPRHIWWNFVSSSKDRIEQAKEDWREGRFDKVADDPEFIPLPET